MIGALYKPKDLPFTSTTSCAVTHSHVVDLRHVDRMDQQCGQMVHRGAHQSLLSSGHCGVIKLWGSESRVRSAHSTSTPSSRIIAGVAV